MEFLHRVTDQLLLCGEQMDDLLEVTAGNFSQALSQILTLDLWLC